MPGQRVFDVFIEADNSASLTSHDVSAEVGTFAADKYIFFVTARDKLRIRFEPRVGDPIINAIRVTHRPDM